jgi:hypothetical protein
MRRNDQNSKSKVQERLGYRLTLNIPLPGPTIGISCPGTTVQSENIMRIQNKTTLLVLTLVATAGLAALAQSVKKPIMNSTAIEWNSIQPKPSATGSSRKFFEGPTATFDMLECHASTLNPGATNHVILRRDHDEVTIVQEGTIEAFVTDKWVRVGPGSVIFNAANDLQSLRNPGPGPATYHVVSFRMPVPAPKPAAEKQN